MIMPKKTKELSEEFENGVACSSQGHWKIYIVVLWAFTPEDQHLLTNYSSMAHQAQILST